MGSFSSKDTKTEEIEVKASVPSEPALSEEERKNIAEKRLQFLNKHSAPRQKISKPNDQETNPDKKYDMIISDWRS